MALNIRRVGEVADGSVTASKLAEGAVDLGSSKVTGQAPASKIADGAVVEAKLADLAISTQKLKDGVVTLAKANDDVKLNSFVGDETEVSVTGVVETVVKEFSFPKHAAHFDPVKLRILASLKTNDVSYIASLKVYLDAEATARITLTSMSTTYELLADEADIADIDTNKKHLVKIVLVSDNASGIVYNDMVDGMLVK
jgi:hypothetical protein